MSTSGRWRLTSKSDPRFDLEGIGEVHVYVLPREAKALLHLKVAELKQSPPEDLEYSFERDLGMTSHVQENNSLN